MIASYILRADILDIIFENRNKAYGAYTLRKFYDLHMVKSLGIVILLLSVFTILTLTAKPPALISVRDIPDHKTGTVISEIPPAKPKERPVANRPDKNMSNTFIMVDSLQKKDSLPEDLVQLPGVEGPNVGDVPLFSGGDPGGDDGPPPPAAITATLPDLPVVDITKPIEKADIDPSYPGGLKALAKFLERNLENPSEVGEGESVSVKVKFVVGFDGELKGFEVKQDGGELFNKEVIRVLKKMPRWIPGKTKGQNVSVYFTIPVKFINEQ